MRAWILCLIGIVSQYGIGQRNVVRTNRDVDRDFEQLCSRLERGISDHNRGLRLSHLNELIDDLRHLRATVENNAGARVDPTTRHTFDLDVDNRSIFGMDPHLPKENKTQGRWNFKTVRFDVASPNMFIFGLQFKASRTIRLRSVTLHFHDGASVTHNGWWDADRGNGQVFKKRNEIPMLNAWKVGDSRRAKRLKSVEIVGSAQDRGHSAKLEFVFRIPDPGQSPYGPAMDLMDRLDGRWSRFEVVDANTLNEVLLDVMTLSDELKLNYCPRIIAFY